MTVICVRNDMYHKSLYHSYMIELQITGLQFVIAISAIFFYNYKRPGILSSTISYSTAILQKGLHLDYDDKKLVSIEMLAAARSRA